MSSSPRARARSSSSASRLKSIMQSDQGSDSAARRPQLTPSARLYGIHARWKGYHWSLRPPRNAERAAPEELLCGSWWSWHAENSSRQIWLQALRRRCLTHTTMLYSFFQYPSRRTLLLTATDNESTPMSPRPKSVARPTIIIHPAVSLAQPVLG